MAVSWRAALISESQFLEQCAHQRVASLTRRSAIAAVLTEILRDSCGREQLKGLTALVTGASSGIGAETAFRFGANGAYTLIHYHENLQGATEVLEKIRQVRGDGELISADLSNSSSIAQFTGSFEKLQRPIDIW